MIKEVVDFLVGYPFWVKVTIVILGAGILLLLIAFRPAPKEPPPPARDHVFRIDRLESNSAYKLISLMISIDGEERRFPSGYEYAAYEQNMAGGEYTIFVNRDESQVIVRARVQLDDGLTKEMQLRQPLRLLAKDTPNSGMAMLRAIDFGAQSTGHQPQYGLNIYYSVK